MDTTISPSQEEKKPRTPLERLLINRNYAYNWIGLTFSQLGNVIFGIALLLWVATTLARNAPWAAFAIGGLALLPTGVIFVSNIFAGVYVDRWDARRTQLCMDGARAILFTVLLLATGIVPLPFPIGSEAANLFQLICVYIAIILNNACDPFVNNALAVLLYDIVDEPDLPRAFGRGQVLNITATIVGPPVGAFIFFTLGIQWAIILNVLSFVISFFSFYMVRLPRKEKAAQAKEEGESEQESAKSGFLHEFLEGMRFTFGNKLLIAIIVAMMLVTAGAGIEVFDLYFATNNLHAAPQAYAYLDVVIGIGAIVGAAFVIPWVRPRIGAVRAYWLSVLINGILFFIFARLTSLASAFVVVFLLGISQSMSSVAFGPIFFKATPRAMMGRVNSVLVQMLTIVTLLSLVLVPLLITALHDRAIQIAGLLFGPIDTLFTAVAVLLITSALYLRVTLNDYAEVLNRPPATDEEGQPQGPAVDLQPSPQQGRLSTFQKQISICVAGVIVAVLVVLPVALTTPTHALSNLQLSRGNPAHGQTVDGMPCQGTLGSAQRASAHLSVYVNDQQASIPAGIGSVAPSQPGVTALASNGQTTCLYPLHVFETDNVIHIDSPTNRTYTLGDFFDIWGQPLSRTQAANYRADETHTLAFYAFDASGNIQNYTDNPRAIPLVEHETIVVVYNSPHAHPVPYNSWNGL
ncbi:MAG TPA: MFS transporter [Ktedonobacteraceae bacterium]|nr:MFS transporter [Ktedonobacteraceae bacterium]